MRAFFAFCSTNFHNKERKVMEVLAKGQLSYMILSCLSERDMYGLELIEEMKARYGREIKLPSLYSNLNRMKELKYISSYLKESTKGPKCSYSSITTAGRQALSELENEFKELAFVAPVEKTVAPTFAATPQPMQENIFEQALRENTNIFTHNEELKPVELEKTSEDAEEGTDDIQEVENMQETEDDLTANEIKTAPVADDYDDYFALDGEESDETQTDEQVETPEEDDVETTGNAEENDLEYLVDKQEIVSEEDNAEEGANEYESEESAPILENESENSLESEEIAEDEIEKEPIDVPEEDDEEVKNTESEVVHEPVAAIDAGEYNQKIYAAAKDFSKNKNKRSYSENQIALALNTVPVRTEENKQESLSQLKEALINSRQGYYEGLEERFAQKQPEIQPVVPPKPEPIQEEEPDDGVFITERVDESAMPKPKKIEPARLNVTLPTAQSYDVKLPAPKRNVAVDPTCKDVKAKLESLYAKAEIKKEPVIESGDFDDYDDLKRYYMSQEVEFKVYERAEKRPKHNTNKLKLFVSLFVLGLIGVGSGLLYMIFALSGLTKPETNFVYYLFPILATVYVLMCFYNYKTTNSKVPAKMMHPAIVWTIFALLIAIVFLINYACGVAFDQVETYFSTILVPIYDCACVTVGLYYAQIHAYKKYWI